MDIVAYQAQYSSSLVDKPENLNQTATVLHDGTVLISLVTKDVNELIAVRDWITNLLPAT